MTPRRRGVAIAAVAGCALALATLVLLVPPGGRGALPEDVPASPGADIATLVRDAKCRECHSTDPGGSEGVAPSLGLVRGRIGERLAASQAASAQAYVAAAIADHCAYEVAGYDCADAPEYGLWLGETEVRALAEWVLATDP